MYWIIAASVVDLPEPVDAGDQDDAARLAPASSLSVSGRPSSSRSGTSLGTTRMTSEIVPRWRKTLTRKRAEPGTE